MVDNTKTIEDPKWVRKYLVKSAICMKATHDYQALMPKEGDKDAEEKTWNGIKFLLKYGSINPQITDTTFENDEFNTKELIEVYNVMCILYNLTPDISKEELEMMKGMNEEQTEQFRMDVAFGRINDLKKKHKLS